MKNRRLPWLAGAVVLLVLGLSLVLLEAFNPSSLPEISSRAFSADEGTPAPPAEDDAWAQAWVSQEDYLNILVTSANDLRKTVPTTITALQKVMAPSEADMRRLFVLSNTYAKQPRVLEAVAQRIYNMNMDIKTNMAEAVEARSAAAELLDKLNQLEKTLPPKAREGKADTKELREYTTSILQARKRLEDIISRLDNALAQPQEISTKLQKATTDITGYLPVLWQQQYLLPPVRYTDPALWTDMSLKMASTIQNFTLRIGLEVPQARAGWASVGGRFVTVLLFGSLLALFLRRRWKRKNAKDEEAPLLDEEGKPVVRMSIFYTSVPWLLCGVALVVAALTSSNDTVYQGLLAAGNLLLIVGQISLAWGLRHGLCERCPRLSPFWPLCVTTLAGYLLLYPGFPVVVVASAWFVMVALSLLWQKQRKLVVPLQLESTVLQLHQVVLWLALFMVVLGLPRYSILFYILFTSISVGLQLSMGGMRALHNVAENQPTEGFKAIMSSIWLALAAPCMIVLVLLGVALWLVTLPGGYYLVYNYALSGFSVGATRFNILQILLIISFFYITRAAVNMGSGFLAKMHTKGIQIDTSLIPPLQTALSYGLWALFGLFALKSLGMELSNLAVVAGGLSVGIGFGMQAIVNNFLSGLILIFSRILQEGDVVDVGGLQGTVRKISVRATTVETYDNAVIYVPNAEFVSNRLINWTRNSRSVRREITVGVAYGTDTDLVMRLLREAANANPGVLKYPAPSVIFSSFGHSTLDFILRFWVHDFDTAVPTASALRQEVEKLFRQNAVEVAFPQMDVHIKEMPLTAKRAKRQAPKLPLPVAPARKLEDMDKEIQAKRMAALGQVTARPGARRLIRRKTS